MTNVPSPQNRSHLIPIEEADDILSLWHREILSSNAIKAYTAIWHRMRSAGSTEVLLTDEQVSIRARVLLQYVSAARTELVSAGLLSALKGALEWRYSYVDQPESDDYQ
jgi:hypothetical protein